MNEKGFIFTLDAILALIPVFIVLLAVSAVDQGSLILPSQQIRLSNQAQDSMDAMAQYNGSEGTILEDMVAILDENNNTAGIDAAGAIAREFLDKNLANYQYKLIEINQLNTSIISKGDMDNAQNVAVGSKNCGEYSFKLYVWDLD